MSGLRMVSLLFYVGGIYDAALGLLFLFVPLQTYSLFSVEPPNHLGYIQFPAMLLIVFGLMFFNIARAPETNRNLIPYGILLKISYCSVVFWYWFGSGIPAMWKPFAILDFIFMLLFFLAYRHIRSIKR
jgi:hypothetical protein